MHAVLGRGLAQDVARTFRMHRAGFDCDWSAIPAVITNKNRIIFGKPRDTHTDAMDLSVCK